MAIVAICTPHGGLVSPKYYRALTVLQSGCPQHQFIFTEVDTQIIGKARNMVTEIALAQSPRPDVIWFIDNDVIVPPNAHVLIDLALNLGIVSGVYYARRPPYTPQIYTTADQEEFKGMYWPEFEDVPTEGLFPRDAVGAGLLCIRTDVFDKLTEMWIPRVKKAADLLTANGFPEIASIVSDLSPWFEFLDKKGEDLYFCERAREAGYTIWVDYNTQAQHLSEIGIDQSHFKYLVDNNLIRKELHNYEVDIAANPRG